MGRDQFSGWTRHDPLVNALKRSMAIVRPSLSIIQDLGLRVGDGMNSQDRHGGGGGGGVGQNGSREKDVEGGKGGKEGEGVRGERERERERERE